MIIETINKDNIKPSELSFLPPKGLSMADIDVSELMNARTEIAELKGYCLDYPNPLLLLSPSIIKESLASSEIENIHTTLINVLQNSLIPEVERKEADKEVLRYREALVYGFNEVSKNKVITANTIINIQNILLQIDKKSFRDSQNAIINQTTGEVVFVPPVPGQILKYIKNFEEYINQDKTGILNDPIILAAVAHFQFESIHPFEDGNGRTGRILMVLQMIKNDLLTAPILYLSSYIQKNKANYYKLLRKVHETNSWAEYLSYMIKAFSEQAEKTKIHLLETKKLFQKTRDFVKEKEPNIYSYELISTLFTSPICTPVFLSEKIGVHQQTAATYLRKLEKLGILKSEKYGKYTMYANIELINLLNK